MRFDLPLGTPSYREMVGKTCAVIDVTALEGIAAGDQFVDPRGHVWAVDHASEGSDIHITRLTLFSSAPAATLKPGEEVRRYEWRRSG